LQQVNTTQKDKFQFETSQDGGDQQQRLKYQGPGLYRKREPDRARCLFEVVDVASVGGAVVLPWGPNVQAPVTVIDDMGTPTSATCGSCVGHGSAMQWSFCAPSMGGAVLVPAFSTADAVVAPAPTTKLVTSAVETADDCSTGASFPFLPNASWLEAFLALSDVAGGALRINNDLSQMEARQIKHTKQDRA
jgi:hypothetical protein